MLAFHEAGSEVGPQSPPGARGDIESAYPAWRVIDEEPMDVSRAPGYVRRTSPRFYRLRRD
jgi:hypothetical protein